MCFFFFFLFLFMFWEGREGKRGGWRADKTRRSLFSCGVLLERGKRTEKKKTKTAPIGTGLRTQELEGVETACRGFSTSDASAFGRMGRPRVCALAVALPCVYMHSHGPEDRWLALLSVLANCTLRRDLQLLGMGARRDRLGRA